MLCSNCGKQTPFVGNVCHWCGANKSKDQGAQVLGMLFGLVFAAIGGVIFGIVGVLVGGIAGVLLALVIVSRKRK